MQFNNKMKMLDQTLCSYVSLKDPSRKSSTNTVFMDKKELSTFYNKMYSKANQQIKLQQNKLLTNNGGNKLLIKQQERIRQKIYSRTLHYKTQLAQIQNLSQKQNIKINHKPMITQNSFKNKDKGRNRDNKDKVNNRVIKSRQDSRFLLIANQQLLMSQFLQVNKMDGNMVNSKNNRKIKSLSQSILNNNPYIINSIVNNSNNNNNKSVINNDNVNNNNELSIMNKSSSIYIEQQGDDNMPHRRVQLIELYQKLYNQFTLQKLKTMHNKSRIQGKFSKLPNNNKSPLLKLKDIPITKNITQIINKKNNLKL